MATALESFVVSEFISQPAHSQYAEGSTATGDG